MRSLNLLLTLVSTDANAFVIPEKTVEPGDVLKQRQVQ